MKFVIGLICFTLPLLALAEKSNNVIVVVSDGMGYSMTTGYRHYISQQDSVKKTVFDRLLVGSSSTHPASTSGIITDSAASATSLATGIKTYNSAIGVNVKKQPVENIIEIAKKKNKLVGVITTSQINHATPAAFIVHNQSRNNFNAIANSYFDDKVNGRFKADVMLGGGTHYFMRKDRNLVKAFQYHHYQYLTNFSDLDSIKRNQPILGLFADKGLMPHIDSPVKYRLTKMLKATLQHFEHQNNPNGFFIVIEASQIDWAAHSNDVTTMFAEIDEFADLLKFLEEYSQKNPNTLILSTSDHETGGFSVGANDQYKWDYKTIREIKSSPKAIAQRLIKTGYDEEYLTNTLNFSLTHVEALQLRSLLNNPDSKELGLDNETLLQDLLIDIINNKTFSGWTTKSHTGVDVPIYALGNHKAHFTGHLDNTEIAKKLISIVSEN